MQSVTPCTACNFCVSDGDGVIYPWDTYNGFRKLGFGWITSALALAVIHGTFSIPTQVL
jgi:hypothetical protein